MVEWRKHMKQHSYTLLKTITVDGENMIYRPEVVANYFQNECYDRILNLTPEEKHAWFCMHRDNEDLFTKMYRVDEDFVEVMGEGYSLSKAVREFPEGIDADDLLEEYRDWLKNQ